MATFPEGLTFARSACLHFRPDHERTVQRRDRLRKLDPCDRPRRGQTPHFYCSRDRQPDMCGMLYGSLFRLLCEYLNYDFSSYWTCPQYRHRGFEEVSFSAPDIVDKF